MLVQPHSASPQVAGAIRQAATSTGASFNYLLTTAQIESNFNPAAQAATSTAKGLYQFIDQTWLGTMKAAGRALGLDRFAAAISRGEDGRFEVQDSSTRQAIMNLRGDPKVSAMLAGTMRRPMQRNSRTRSAARRRKVSFTSRIFSALTARHG